MPAAMTNPYPMAFVERADGDIVVRFEEFDSVRTIHMTDVGRSGRHPGISHGLFDRGTGKAKRSWYRHPGSTGPTSTAWAFPRAKPWKSSNASRLSRTRTRLDYQLMVTDPAILIEPFVWEGYWDWRPGEEVHPYDCTVGD